MLLCTMLFLLIYHLVVHPHTYGMNNFNIKNMTFYSSIYIPFSLTHVLILFLWLFGYDHMKNKSTIDNKSHLHPVSDTTQHTLQHKDSNRSTFKMQRYPITVSWLIRSMAGSELLLQEADPSIIEVWRKSSRWQIRWSNKKMHYTKVTLL